MDISNYLKTLKGRTLLLTHHNADLDAIASVIGMNLGLKQIGIESDIGVAESVSKISKKISEKYKIIIDPDCGKYDNVILLDTSVSEQLKSVKNLRADAIIDHHVPGNMTEKTKILFINEKAKSAAQMVYEILDKLKVKINKEISEIILIGIIADTAHLRLADLDTLKIIVKLLENDVDLQKTMELIISEPDASESIASLKAARSADIYRVGELIVTFSKAGSHEAASCRNILKLGADIAIVATIRDDEVRISSRGKKKILEKGIDLSVIFKEVGTIISGSGGGHDLAGSANGKDSVDKAFKFILNEISKKAGNVKKL